jgi:hypothetical protein
METYLAGASSLYTNVLIQTSRHLDSLADIPFDSCSLTSFLHSRGVNCRQLGILYQLSATRTVKQLLLVEALARTFKHIFTRTLRNLSRQMKSRSIVTLLIRIETICSYFFR